jgi:hypothetical protein
MAFEGDVRTMPVRDLFEWLMRREATGTLSVSQGMVVRRFHLERGRVTLASSSEQGRLLGQLLVDMGRIDAAQLETALEARHRYGERLGITLTLAGLLSEREVAKVLRDKVTGLLADTLTWAEGRFSYDDGAGVPATPLVPIMLDLTDLLVQAPDLPLEDAVLEPEVIESLDLS